MLHEHPTVNLETMVIEDTFEGIGCIGPEAILVTDFGMFFTTISTLVHTTVKNLFPIEKSF